MYVFPKPFKEDIFDSKFIFSKKVYLYTSKKYVNEAFIKLYKELWSNFTFGLSDLEFVIDETLTETAVLSVSRYKKTNGGIAEKYEYEIFCSADSINISFKDKIGFSHALATILQMISCSDVSDSEFYIPCCNISDKPDIDFRGIHICVFPETSLDFIRKTVRICGLMKYSHIILEFWGMLKYECLDSLGWRDIAFEKKQIKPIIDEGIAMGMEFIPMFNHWGHASQSRAVSGKHTVLDQNPKLEPLFEPDGWTWCISNPDTLSLLRKIRSELIDLFGKGSYFHLGCDEAYTYATCNICSKKDKQKLLTEYINGVAAELQTIGRKSIMWADMTLNKDDYPQQYCTTHSAGFSQDDFLKGLDENIILNDWQYYIDNGEYMTVKHLLKYHKRENIFVSPWYEHRPIEYLCKKVKELRLGGVIETTWNTLSKNYVTIMLTALHCWEKEFSDTDNWQFYACRLAMLVRKVKPANGVYEKTGFIQHQLFD